MGLKFTADNLNLEKLRFLKGTGWFGYIMVFCSCLDLRQCGQIRRQSQRRFIKIVVDFAGLLSF